MLFTAQTLAAITGRPENDNMRSATAGLQIAGATAGLTKPHRLAMYIGQLAHESMGFHYDREVWGPTGAQKRYDTRTDLGNTPQRDGDGFKFRGRGPIQITGRANYGQFTQWARGIKGNAPDFMATPAAVLTDPWEGLVAIWYWQTRKLNKHADRGDYMAVTRLINGGTNGLADRQAQYTRAALVLLGYMPTNVRGFQYVERLAVDGAAGPNTRAALHRALKKLAPVRFEGRPATPPAHSPLAAMFQFLANLFGANK